MGRRQVMILNDIIGIIGCLFFIKANIWIAIAGRFVCGIAVGLNGAVVP